MLRRLVYINWGSKIHEHLQSPYSRGKDLYCSGISIRTFCMSPRPFLYEVKDAPQTITGLISAKETSFTLAKKILRLLESDMLQD